MASPVVDSTQTNVDSTGTASSLTVSDPSGTAVGKLLIAYLISRVSSATWTAPAGWLRLLNTGATGVGVSSFMRRCDGTETGSEVFSQSGVSRMFGGIVCVSGADSADPIDTVLGTSNSTSGLSLSANGFSPIDAPNLLLAFFGGSNGNGTLTLPGDLTQDWNRSALVTAASAPHGGLGHRSLPDTSPTGTETASYTVSCTSANQQIVIRSSGSSFSGWGVAI